MSLIHDALKKAQEGDKKPLGTGVATLQEATRVTEDHKVSKRVIVLSGVFLVVLGILAYMWFTPSKEVPKPKASLASKVAVPKQPTKKDIELLKKRAVDAYRAVNYDEAWSNLNRAVAMDNADPEIWNNMGLVAKKRGDLEAAKKNYEKALELKPDYPEALNNLAVVEFRTGDEVRAIELLEKSLEVMPAYPEANFHLGLIFEERGKKKEALEYYRRFLDVSGSFPSNIVDSVRDHIMELEP